MTAPSILPISTIDHTTGRFTIANHGFTTGDGPVAIYNPNNGFGNVPTGLAAGTDYWVIRVDANTIKLAASNALALAGTAIALSDNGNILYVYLLFGIPYRHATTYVAGTSQIKAADLQAIQDALKQQWVNKTHGPLTRWINPSTPNSLGSGNSMQPNFLQISGSNMFTGMPLGNWEEGDRILKIQFRVSGAPYSGSFQLYANNGTTQTALLAAAMALSGTSANFTTVGFNMPTPLHTMGAGESLFLSQVVAASSITEIGPVGITYDRPPI